MSPEQQKAFCALRFEKWISVMTVWRDFRQKINIEPSKLQSIRRWHKTFQETDCLFKRNLSGRPRTPSKNVEQIRQSFGRSPEKSVCHASRELVIPQNTV